MLAMFTISALTVGFSVIFHAFITAFKPSKCIKVVKKASKVLFLSAHPDDECMFFGPSIRSFLSSGCDVYILCLSSGNFDGCGHIRKKEFYKSCEIIGLPKSNVTLIQHSQLQDNPNLPWLKHVIGNLVMKYIKQLSIDTVVTFDDAGVSGHLNHISCYKGMLYILENELLPQDCTIFTLLSVNKLRKYGSILEIPFSFLLSENILISDYKSIIICQKAMQAHGSQLVWFRWLYIIFSSYMIVNSLQRLELPYNDTSTASLLYKLQ